jgi:hypothetical protein
LHALPGECQLHTVSRVDGELIEAALQVEGGEDLGASEPVEDVADDGDGEIVTVAEDGVDWPGINAYPDFTVRLRHGNERTVPATPGRGKSDHLILQPLVDDGRDGLLGSLCDSVRSPEDRISISSVESYQGVGVGTPLGGRQRKVEVEEILDVLVEGEWVCHRLGRNSCGGNAR